MIFNTMGCGPPSPNRTINDITSKLANPDYFPLLKEKGTKSSSNKSKVHKMCIKEDVICIPKNYSKLELPDQLKATNVVHFKNSLTYFYVSKRLYQNDFKTIIFVSLITIV